jgi:hypothetical protein
MGEVFIAGSMVGAGLVCWLEIVTGSLDTSWIIPGTALILVGLVIYWRTKDIHDLYR